LAGAAARFTHESLLNDHPVNGEAKQVYDTPAVMQPSMYPSQAINSTQPVIIDHHDDNEIHQHEEVEESLNIMDKEKELIEKALKKAQRQTQRCLA